ncbi:MAG: Coenzyme F420 hydrogenase/dehydrogenase, beta subunit C-terminal domain [Atribacterota bacterium]
MINNKVTVKKIVDEGLCTGCGTCSGTCPNSAINMVINSMGIYDPKLIDEKCNKCGICLNSCPGKYFDFDNFNLEIFGKKPENVLLGNFINCYLAHATDCEIRYNSASGGLVTSLLIYVLEKGIIDGALVTRMKKDKPLEPEPFIARTKEEIVEASKSKYCPVPVNVALNEILNSKKGEKFAVVGLPCHIQGVRKAEVVNKKLREKIVLHLGIFCSHTDSFRGTEFLLHKLGIKKEKVMQIDYRGEGWPGEVRIKLKSGREKVVKLATPLWFSFHDSCSFSPIRCLLCNDLTAEFTDISFGDAWLPEIVSKEQVGKSIIISRTKQGEELLNAANSDGYIELSQIEPEKVIQSQKTFLHFKKINLKERIRLRRLFGKESPQISKYKTKINPYNKFVAALSLINSYLGQKFEFPLRYIPINILRKYTSAFYLLCSLARKRDFNKLSQDKNGLNILILNAHWNNRGDEAAIRAMIDSLRSKLLNKNMKIMILSKNPTYFTYEDIGLLDSYPTIEKKTSSILSLGMDIFLTIITFGKLTFTDKGKKFISAVHDADIVIHAPGGPAIGDLYGGKYGIGEFFYLYRLLIPILKGKPVFFYAPSMGPFSGTIRNIIRKFILRRSSAIILREEISSKYLKEQLGLDSYVTLDSVLQNDISKEYIKRYINISEILNTIENEKVVGMTLTDLKWHPVYKNNIKLHEKIIHSLSGVIEYLINNGYIILLIPQLFGWSDDVSLLKEFYKLNKKKIFILPTNIDSYAQQIIISKLFCMISMRYHPNIFAAKGNIPSICIYYEHKAKGFMEKLGRIDLMINIEEISASKIIDKFTYLEGNYNTIKEQLKKRTTQLKEESQKTTEIIIEKLKQLGVVK